MSYTLPAKTSTARLSYWIQTERLSPYGENRTFPHGMVYFHIRHVTVESMASILAGTVGNAAGYGNVEAAERVGRSAASAVRAGITDAYSTTWGGPDVTLKYQQYNDTSYCGGPRVEFGGDGDYASAERGLDFLRWLARKADKAAFADANDVTWVIRHVLANPSKVANALDRVGAVRLMPWANRRTLIGEGGCFWLPDTEARVELATDERDGVAA